MERKIGEIFEYNGEWYQCVESDSCGECSLFTTECGSGTKSDLADKIFGQCSRVRRSDNKHAIFKKLEKAGEMYEKRVSDGTFSTFQRYKVYNSVILPKEPYMYCNFIDNTIEIEIKQNKENMNKINLTRKETDFLLNKLQDILSNYVHGGESSEIESAIEDIINVVKEPDLKMDLKPFNLEAAKAGKPVCTRDGRKARIICFDSKQDSQRPIIALITDNNRELLYEYTIDGKDDFAHRNYTGTSDLMMLPEKKEGWVNVYNSLGVITFSHNPYDTKEEALASEMKAPILNKYYVDTVKVEWEE